MSLIKQEPSLLGPFDTLMDRWLQDFPFKGEKGVAFRQPAVDVLEDEAAFQIKADLPDIDPKNVEVSIEGDTLTLSGQRNLEEKQERENYRRIERFRGEFQRTFTLPEVIDQEKVKAAFDKGVLTITIPKTKEPARSMRARSTAVLVEEAQDRASVFEEHLARDETAAASTQVNDLADRRVVNFESTRPGSEAEVRLLRVHEVAFV